MHPKGTPLSIYTPMQEVTPKVVAMAVSTVITMFRILLQSSFFIFDLWVMIYELWFMSYDFHHRVRMSYEFYSICHSLLFVIQRSKATKNLGNT